MCKVLGLIPSTAKRKRKEGKKGGWEGRRKEKEIARYGISCL
jgi:hypothetical protein